MHRFVLRKEGDCMKCPICNQEMEEGGLIVDGVAPGWVPMEQFRRKGFKRIVYMGLWKGEFAVRTDKGAKCLFLQELQQDCRSIRCDERH